MECKVKGMVCEVKDNFGNVEKDYMGWLEKAYNSFVYISSWKFNTIKAKKEIKNICDCMVELKDFIDKYELEHEIENLNKDSAQFDCEMYIKKMSLNILRTRYGRHIRKAGGFVWIQRKSRRSNNERYV